MVEKVILMNDEFVLPEIMPKELAEWLKTRPELVVLDVREPYEFPRAKLADERVAYAPLSDLARKGLDGMPDRVKENKAATTVVICHHGNRSAQVTAWLLDQGWEKVYNLAGGIDAYALLVDPGVGRY
jgi:rhodanese-related sulfurtransferase